jgi:hypothetical protein
MNKDLAKDIKKLCNYLAYDEKKDWEELDKPKNHIWVTISRIKKYLKFEEGLC